MLAVSSKMVILCWTTGKIGIMLLGNLYNGFVLDGMVIMSSFGAAASNATLAGVKREGGKGNEKEGNGGGGGGGGFA